MYFFRRLMSEQRQRDADAERLEAQASKARMEAKAASDRIQLCKNSLQAAESKLAAKKHEISLKVGGSTFDPFRVTCLLCIAANNTDASDAWYLECIPAMHYCWWVSRLQSTHLQPYVA